jgi:hypothetical protein
MSGRRWSAISRRLGWERALNEPSDKACKHIGTLNDDAVAHMDDDLAALSREELTQEIRRLRAGIRAHRDATGHDLCWHHPALWGLLPEGGDPAIAVPPWPKFLRGCIRYRQSLDEQRPDAPVHDAEFGDEI